MHKKGDGANRTAARHSCKDQLLAERVRDVVERRVELVANALHRANGSDGNQSCDEAVFNGGRALLVLNQLQKVDHLRSPTLVFHEKGAKPQAFATRYRRRLR